jgi:hypothetical protein
VPVSALKGADLQGVRDGADALRIVPIPTD